MSSFLDCPHCGEVSMDAKRGHHVDKVFRGVLFWECLSCGKAWPRHFVGGGDETKRLAIAARSYAIEWNRSRG